METKSFNLLHKPWIMVMDDEGSASEISLLSLFERAHEFRSLAGELLAQDIALLRLLLAVLHAVFSQKDANGNDAPIYANSGAKPRDALLRWSELWGLGQFPHKVIHDYLLDYEDRFDLFDPDRPFFQAPIQGKATDYTASKLIGELSESGNKVRLFKTRAGEGKERLNASEAARWLLYVNAFDDTSAKPSISGLPSAGAGWLGKLGLITAVGENLFETLMLNLVLLNENDELWAEEKPIWEQDVRLGERTPIPVPDNLSQLYTLQSRRLKLEHDGECITAYKLLGGDFFEKEKAFVEQMTLWRGYSEKKGQPPQFLPKRHQAERQLWRDFSSLIAANSKDHHRPGVISWIALLKIEGYLPSTFVRFQTASVLYGDKDFFVNNSISDIVSFNAGLLADKKSAWRERIEGEIVFADLLVWQLGELAKAIAIASGDRESKGQKAGATQRRAAMEQGYFRLDMPFRHWLEGIDPDEDDIDDKCDDWWTLSQGIIRQFGEELVKHASPQAFAGRNVDGFTVVLPRAYNYFLYRTYNKENLSKKGGEQNAQ